jgi:glycosyltransferase involved in cell wall biosynthesis
MISVLVPVYNTAATALVQSLRVQLETLGNLAEVIVMDDGSNAHFKALNQSLHNYPNMRYIELNQNVGRVQVRKRLASEANYPWLLFIDGDSLIRHPSYVENYIHVLSSDVDVIVGGRTHQSDPPDTCSLRLHWRYGTKREDSRIRKTGFISNNFCIRKEVFQKLMFNLPLQGYGHEDTWIGLQLEALGAKIGYIQNPVFHNGLEHALVFLEKSDQALKNLLILSKFIDQKVLSQQVKLYRYYCIHRRWHLERSLLFLFRIFRKLILKNLISCYPSLKLFDFYRLCRFIQLSHSAKAIQSARVAASS